MSTPRRLQALVGLVTAGTIAFTAAIPATATQAAINSETLGSSLVSQEPTGPELTDTEKQSLLNEFLNLGVDRATAANLVEKYNSGELLDSLNPNIQPVKIVQSETDGVVTTTETYPDGSVAVGTISDLAAIKDNTAASSPQGMDEVQSVYGCKYTSGGNYAGYWKNCYADANRAIVRMGFRFDYQTVRGVGSKITNYHTYFHHIIGGSLSNFRFNRLSDTQVRLSADLDFAFKGFPVGWTAWMQANVSGTKAWTTHN